MKFEKEDNWDEFKELRIPNLTWKTLKRGIYNTTVNNKNWMIRMNNFPEEPVYTLIIDSKEIIHFNDWPMEWKK